MATSFGALCDDFYINQAIAVKMDLPTERDTLLHMFDRVRADQPTMARFQRYPDELILESPRRHGAYRWLSIRSNTLSSGCINPETLEEAYELHRLVLKLSPYHLSISPLDVDFQELMLGFDLDAEANHNEVVHNALFADTPVAALLDYPGAQPVDVQPIFGLSLNDRCDLQAFFDVRTTTSNAQIRRGTYRNEPISVMLTLRKLGPVDGPDDLLTNFEQLREQGEKLASDRLVPHLLNPISRAITSSA